MTGLDVFLQRAALVLLVTATLVSCAVSGDRPATPLAAGEAQSGNRITSYNVCYTKLLRQAPCRRESLLEAAPTCLRQDFTARSLC